MGHLSLLIVQPGLQGETEIKAVLCWDRSGASVPAPTKPPRGVAAVHVPVELFPSLPLVGCSLVGWCPRNSGL